MIMRQDRRRQWTVEQEGMRGTTCISEWARQTVSDGIRGKLRDKEEERQRDGSASHNRCFYRLCSEPLCRCRLLSLLQTNPLATPRFENEFMCLCWSQKCLCLSVHVCFYFTILLRAVWVSCKPAERALWQSGVIRAGLSLSFKEFAQDVSLGLGLK